MNYDWQMDLRPSSGTAATVLPPAMVEETGWDILLALRSDQRCGLSLGKLGAIISVPQPALVRWFAGLEQRRLITGNTDSLTGEVQAVLTPAGRELLDKYLSATSDLQVGAHH